MKYNLFVLIATLFCLAACKNNSSQNQESAREAQTGTEAQTSSDSQTQTDASQPAASDACYRSLSGKDSVLLHIERTGNTIKGDLIYTFFEKDNNTGTLEGEMSGDTLFADYTFRSEGQQSVREVAFLQKGDELVEGFGPVKETGNKMVFENRGALQFTNKLTYRKVDCNPDAHGCAAAVGYYWSSLKNSCVRPLETGVRLNAGAEASSKAKPAFVLFSEDKKQAELFLPGAKAALLLQQKGEEGKKHWENGDWKLYAWKGYVLKQNDKLAYAGQ